MPWGPLLIAAQLGAALVVQTDAPDAMCPDLTQTREAVAKRLGTLAVDNSGWVVHYTIGHSPDVRTGDFVRLELWDPQGTRRLERDLPLRSGSCSTMAQAIAVVVDRFFRSLAQQESSLSEAAPAEKANADASRTADEGHPLRPLEPADSPREGERELERPSSAPQRAFVPAPASEPVSGVNLGVLGSYLVESFGVQVTLEAPLGNRIHLGFSTVVPFNGPSKTVEGRSISLRSYPQRVWLAVGNSSSRYWFDAGPELFTVIERADGGDLIGGQSATRVIPGLGVSLGGGARLTARVGFGLRAGVDVTHPPLARQFMVTTEQGAEEVFAAPRFRASAGAGVFFWF
jgi:hypothetical protein